MEHKLDWNTQMHLVQALLCCTDGELECIEEKELDSYIDDVERIYSKLEELGKVK